MAKDLNLDGIPELITVEYGGHTYTSIKVSIFEWNGSSFVPLLQGKSDGEGKYFPFVDTDIPANISIRDTDHNGTLELLVESTLPVPMPCLYTYLMPWRDETRIYSWNGSLFILDRVEYSAPEFRFQAIQDGDYAAAHGDTAGALAIYQDAIHSNKLKVFSEQILENEMLSSCMDPGWTTPTPVSPDTTEYPRLAAYAYYRILLLHIVQGHESDAGTVYKTLQQKFGSSPYGHPYVEMATVFWEAYQSTHQIYDGCAAAIEYAAKHPEILIPLGSDYHGGYSHTYVPADVCPFR